MFDVIVKSDNCKLIPPDRSGVYVLSDENGFVFYVGKSINVRKRILTHIYDIGGNSGITEYSGNFKEISVIFHDDITTLDELETKIIDLLKPAINIAKVNYDKTNIKIPGINPPVDIKEKSCKHVFDSGIRCRTISFVDGYCDIHDPNRIVRPPYEIPDSPTETAILKIIYELDNADKNKNLFIYMNSSTLIKLKSETNNCRIDYSLDIPRWRYRKHFIIIDNRYDEIEIVRYER